MLASDSDDSVFFPERTELEWGPVSKVAGELEWIAGSEILGVYECVSKIGSLQIRLNMGHF